MSRVPRVSYEVQKAGSRWWVFRLSEWAEEDGSTRTSRVKLANVPMRREAQAACHRDAAELLIKSGCLVACVV